jgi:DNA-binding MarR family transcriptional regulator
MGRYNAAIRTEMAHHGLTTPKMRALAVLSVMQAPLIRELAFYAVVEQSTLSRSLDQLEADGLVRRESDSADSRATRIHITPQGRALFEEMWPHMAEAQEALFRGISDEERGAFLGTLQRMLRNIRKHDF